MFNVVTCGEQKVEEVGKALMEDEQVAMLSFTGSTFVGKVRERERASERERERERERE